MIVTCERCSARYKLDDNKIKGRGARITCPKCQHVFVVYRRGAEAEATSGAPAASSNPLAQDQEIDSGGEVETNRSAQLDFRKVGISTWKVKVKIGLVYDFSDIGTLRKYIQDRRVTEDDVISHDGSSWVRIGDIPDLDGYFVKVYEDLEAHLLGQVQPEEDTGEFEDDGPTMVVGMGSLRANISTGVFQKPGAPAENVPAAARSLGAPSGPAAGGDQRFVDPFETLKARQRERLRARRKAESGGRGGGARSGKGGRSTEPARHNVWLYAAAVVAVVAVIWFFFPRGPAPTAPTTPIAEASPPPAKHVDPALARKELIAKIEAELASADEEPPETTQDADDQGGWIPVSPEDRARMAGEGTFNTSPGFDHPGGQISTTDGGFSGSDQPASRTTTAADHVLVGDAKARSRDWVGAAAAYKNAVALDSRNSSYRYKWAEALYHAGQLDQALGQFDTLAASGMAAAQKYRGRILNKQGDEAGAVEAFRAYLNSSPRDAAQVQRELDEITNGA